MPIKLSGYSNADKSGFVFSYIVYAFALTLPVSIIPAQILGALLILFGALLLIKYYGNIRITGYWVVFAAGLITITFISAIFSPYLSNSPGYLKKFWVILSIFPMVYLSFLYSRRTTLIFLFWGTVIASFIGIYRVIFDGIERAAPYSGGYTTLAVFEAALLPVALSEILSRKSPKRFIYAIGMIVLIVGLILTRTRAGWLAAIVGIMIYGASINWKKTAIAVLVFIAVIVALPPTRQLVFERFSVEKEGGFTSGRTVLYKGALRRLDRLPFFGYGPASFSSLITEEELNSIGDRGIKSWHNTPLEILMDNGPVGLFSLLGISLIPLWRSIRTYKGNQNRKSYPMTPVSSVLTIYVAGLTTNIMRDFMSLSLLVIFWAISFSSNFHKGNVYEQ